MTHYPVGTVEVDGAVVELVGSEVVLDWGAELVVGVAPDGPVVDGVVGGGRVPLR